MRRDRLSCGRTAIFELLIVGDAVRQALTSNPTLEAVRQAARKDGMKTFQEEGVLAGGQGHDFVAGVDCVC